MRARLYLFIAVSLALLASIPAGAAVPGQITVQGKLTDASGNPLSAGDKLFTFKIYNAEVGGTKIWPAGPGEDQTITTGTDGLWVALVGAISPVNDAVFADTVRWLEITVDGTTLPRVRLVTGPFAYRVATVDGASGGTITSKVSIGPGHTNTGAHAFVAGQNNAATGDWASIGGGQDNQAEQSHSTVGGGGSNVAHGLSSTVGGGYGNRADSNDATVSGGLSNSATGGQSTVGGGALNGASGPYATIAGGLYDSAKGSESTIGGGTLNTASGERSTVAGGFFNLASRGVSAVGGGAYNAASGHASFVGGGLSDTATGDVSTIAGGWGNAASGDSSTIAGGTRNSATGISATVGGGRLNTASNENATVAGGIGNTASGRYATVGGGSENRAVGPHSTVPGGYFNFAPGPYSFAAGFNASAVHAGSFVWSDTNSNGFASTGANQFLIHASGGVGINTNAPEQPLHVHKGSAGFVTAFGNSIAVFENNTSGYLSILTPNNVDNGILFGNPSSNVEGGILYDNVATPNGMQFRTNGNVARMVVDATGHVGVGGITAPSNVITAPDIAGVDGRGLADRWDVYSSRRWKDSVVTITSAARLVTRLRGVRYVDKSTGTHDIGLIAEEVGEVFPEIVQFEDNGVDARSMDYARLVAVLIEGMKEQQGAIHTLRARLEKIEAQVQTQANR